MPSHIVAMLFNRDLIDFDWPDGWIESQDEHVEPKSLYKRQLEERLLLGARTDKSHENDSDHETGSKL